MNFIQQAYRTVTRTRYVRSLEEDISRQRAEGARQQAEIERLRGENRALLNSILGVAGIPPIPAERSTERAAQTAASLLAELAPSESAAAPAAGEMTSTESIPARRHSESARADDESALRPPPPATTAAEADSLGSRSPIAHDGRPRNDSPHPHNATPPRMRPLAMPVRRRSWHQITRMLEMDERKSVTRDS